MRIVTSILLAAFALVATAASSMPQQAPGPPITNPKQPPTIKSPDCTTSGCHADQVKGKFLHAPAASGACEMCHVDADVARHTFTLKHQGAELCSFCHLGKTDAPGMHMHAPVREGKCVECHEPHGSAHRFLIKGETTGAMCLSCHQAIIGDRAHVHTPIAQGDCMGCHKAHASALPGLLVEQGRALCIKCHANVEKAPAHAAQPGSQPIDRPLPAVLGAHDAQAATTSPTAIGLVDSGGAAGMASLVAHEPFKGECTQCHDQHASNQAALLKQEPKQLCISCHAAIARKLADAVVPHSAATVDRACLNCHSPHVGHDETLLRDSATKVCLDCHNQPIRKADGVTVASIADMLAEGRHLHSPIETTGCGKCHDVHGGAHAALLTQPYNQSFYQPYSTEAYGLCFTCHDSRLASEQSTTSATKFRNGDVNLHYVHVAGQGDAGRSCRVCHDTHSAKNVTLLRDSVPYGNWQVPITYEATATGGSCGAGCHRARTYERGPSALNLPSATPSN